MADFNYKNAYKLAIQTNREIHKTLDNYKILVAQLKADLDAEKAENKQLRERIDYLEDIQNWKFGGQYEFPEDHKNPAEGCPGYKVKRDPYDNEGLQVARYRDF